MPDATREGEAGDDDMGYLSYNGTNRYLTACYLKVTCMRE